MLVAELPLPPAPAPVVPVAPVIPAALPAAPITPVGPPPPTAIAIDTIDNVGSPTTATDCDIITGVTVDTIDGYAVAVNFEVQSTYNGATMNFSSIATGNDWGTCYCDAKATRISLGKWNQKKYARFALTGNVWQAGNTWNTAGTSYYSANSWATVNLNVKRWRSTGGWGGQAFWVQEPPPLSKVDEFRKKLRENMQPEIVTKNRDLWGINLTEQEIRARTLLLELIGEEAFRRYLRRGFIVVKGMTGTLYKISGGNTRIISYVKNVHGHFQAFEEFCVQFREYNLPFTDGVIMRKLLVESDEFQLRKVANVWQINKVNKAQPMVAAAG